MMIVTDEGKPIAVFLGPRVWPDKQKIPSVDVLFGSWRLAALQHRNLLLLYPLERQASLRYG